MAEIKDGIYAYVSGTVGRVFQTKNGPAVEVHVMPKNGKFPDRVTVWGLGDQVAEGDRVTVNGWWSDRREVYQKQDGTEGVAFRRALNSPVLEAREAGSGGGFAAAPVSGTGGGGFAAQDAPGVFDTAQPF